MFGICTQKRALPDPKAFNGMMAAMSLPTMQQENFQKMCLQICSFIKICPDAEADIFTNKNVIRQNNLEFSQAFEGV
uniref:Uncharacterized protein n=1 Tax=Magallana gigas TaxID=29159 RepID=K1PJK5_MAGGI